jgi:acetolactate synthase-1/2/3 large subunit
MGGTSAFSNYRQSNSYFSGVKHEVDYLQCPRLTLQRSCGASGNRQGQLRPCLWVVHFLFSFRARQVLIRNGQQTLGVALPWGIASCLVRPNEKTLSISGDGGFLFSAMELETAVRLKLNLVHMVWIDRTYDMVAVQEQPKYKRTSGVDFGPVDVVKYAEAFEAIGFMVDTPGQIKSTLKQAFEIPGPVLIGS